MPSSQQVVLSHVVCVARNDVIGSGQHMPWHIKEDLKRFKEITYGSPIIMGRKTWESLPGPLPGREAVIVTRQNYSRCATEARVCSSVEEACLLAGELTTSGKAFIIGGGEIYRASWPMVQRIYLTRLHRDYPGNVTYPAPEGSAFKEVYREPFIGEDRHLSPEVEHRSVRGVFLIYQREESLSGCTVS